MKFMKNVFLLLVFCQSSFLIGMQLENISDAESMDSENKDPFIIKIHKNKGEGLQSAYYELYLIGKDQLIQSRKKLLYVYEATDDFFKDRIFVWRKNFSKKGATVKNQIALSGEDTKDFIAIIGNELAKEKKLIEYCKQNIDQRIKIVIKLPQFGARTSKATLINLPQKNNDGSEKVDLTKGNTKEDPIVLE